MPVVGERVGVLDRGRLELEVHLLGAPSALLDHLGLLHALGPLGVGREVRDHRHHLRRRGVDDDAGGGLLGHGGRLADSDPVAEGDGGPSRTPTGSVSRPVACLRARRTSPSPVPRRTACASTPPPLTGHVVAASTGNLTDDVVRNGDRARRRRRLLRDASKVPGTTSPPRSSSDEVRAVAKGLIAAGIEAGDRVALISRTRYEWTLLDYAIWFAGAATVPVYETSQRRAGRVDPGRLRRPGGRRRDARAPARVKEVPRPARRAAPRVVDRGQRASAC